MESRTNLPVFTFLLVLISLCSVSGTAAWAADAEESQFPYLAESIGDDVYIRSGPGTNYYFTGKLSKGEQVTVVSSKFTWLCIIPPKDSFSWISKRYVKLDADNPSVGSVTGDNVRVYAGSDTRKQMRSTTLQVRLDKGEKVNLMPEQDSDGDYYKIRPPAAAYLWVSTDWLKPVNPVKPEPVKPEPDQPVSANSETTQPDTTNDTAADPNTTTTSTPTPTPTAPDNDETATVKPPVVLPNIEGPSSEDLEKFYTLQKIIEEERKKPLEQQDYTEIKKRILALAEKEDGGKAARYSQFEAKRIDRFEMALKAAKEIKLQDAQIATAKEKIEKATAAKLESIPDLGKFAAIGTLRTSSVYHTGANLTQYRLLDASGKMICYAFPTSQMNLNDYIGKRVGLIGKIEPLLNSENAVVKFSGIEKL